MDLVLAPSRHLDHADLWLDHLDAVFRRAGSRDRDVHGGAHLDHRARLGLGGLGGLLGPAETNLPIPRLVVDDLDLGAGLERLQYLHRLLIAHVPLAWGKVNEGALEGALGHEVDTLDVAPAQVNENLLDAPPVDVVKHPRDAQANARSRIAIMRRVIHPFLSHLCKCESWEFM